MSTSTLSEDVLKEEIARLSGAINRHKTGPSSKSVSFSGRSNAYVNPNYRSESRSNYTTIAPAVAPVPVQPREVVIDGVPFQSSKRSLVRKDLAKPPPTPKPSFRPIRPPRHEYARKYAGIRAPQRSYKSKASRRIPQNHNMTLNNGKKPVRMGRKTKSMKYVDKQCPRFSTTGVCTKGLTCFYKHDPARIAICWSFLYGNCPNTAESCSLSHDPTPERTPLCVHFANNGRCKNGDDCLFPHVRVGSRTGVCRDFAVLGYCDKGIDCEHQHVRECPDFAERGTCPNPLCKLPHVIRANQRRADATKSASGKAVTAPTVPSTVVSKKSRENSGMSYGDDAKIGDEYISLTFHESEDSDEDGDDSEVDEDDVDADGDEDEEYEEESDSNGDMEVHL